MPRLNGFRYGLKKFPHKDANEKRHIAILVPARNESSVIGDLLTSIKAQDYDKSCFDVFVIVKEENDPTIEIVKKFGLDVTVIPTQHCKGDALDGFFKTHSEQQLAVYDAFVIVDADGVLSPSYLSELNNALDNQADIFVTRKVAKNFLGDKKSRSVFSNCSALTYPLVDDLGNAYRTKKGMPLNICGQGLMIRRNVIEDIGGWPYRTMTEDYELKLDSMLRGYKSMYYPYAMIYTEEAISHHETFARRVRWLIGYKQCDKKYKDTIKKQVKNKKHINRGEVEYFFGLLPYFLFMIATFLTAAVGIALTIYYHINDNAMWKASLMILTVMPLLVLYGLLHLCSWFALLISYDEFSAISKKELVAVALFNPFYMLEYVCVYLASLKKIHSKEAVVWKQTERITNKRRNKIEVVEGVHNTLELNRKFHTETISYGNKWIMPDENYRYREAWYDKIITGFWRSVLALFGPILIKIAFRARVVGKENLKAVRKSGAITVCNHFHYLDTLFVRQAIGHYKSYHTMAPFNNKSGAGGHIIRHGGMMPFSANLTAMRNLDAEINRQLARGKRVNFYPEHAMWWNYQKPRPMKDGAFHYAVKFKVPVVPIFCTFKKTKRGGIRKLYIHILPAVYADEALPRKEQIIAMKATAESEWKTCYEQAYGKKLEYLSSDLKNVV
ncbi:MAG: glycosyltransferase [Clostridiales bacterium]|nr:glycosyltransferase [Clostridiales bacterium]